MGEEGGWAIGIGMCDVRIFQPLPRILVRVEIERHEYLNRQRLDESLLENYC